ncbi:MAG: DNA topoisomerase IV subunit A [Ferrovum sp. 37-45-19]|jgi:topoisomerase-4 subunit A|uniref:DNA topoisomerase IV subunit A n=1 Tax=Ferrovum sp. JA12 TaxID=1356299 RepID=UPI0007155556|nr:DNA topoisomerase IV subunit A [Ferrovum sp. JA12]OYV80322.1 MAG: DNA topoisomerase IV subunit A [Ferrovum sp. 21-44-67]OYV95067.1 MAG: DNA topoisomerase IV subunit A [Ferrovum sp. 37-45-19]HQT80872.1 DNA topoisomerase IV subunit A [Ferrovaceae bacterium]KRH78714.1 DNA topoisomerase 4 subunit A [Ferrovum sp. JA12]HQU06612.1 DNA topoisomerase IV subunit A [Ferrovaceae bacterium]
MVKKTHIELDQVSGDLFSHNNPVPQEPEEQLELSHFIERSYLEYAMSVVMGRAIPDVSDGQKPVQRRILFAMHELGLYRPNRHVKSARVVGDVIGKYHPHGDSAAYEALVRQAQDFTLRYPLIDGQGNFGSRDGDGAAAMRYTECRLTPIAELLLSEIDKDTVDFTPNYDGSFKEPKLLPARLPFVLLNGSSGIGVGMATEIPSHNMREVAKAVISLIQKPDTTISQIVRAIKGPDLPGGGQIISSHSDILSAYETGRGSLKIRARWSIEELARGQWRIVVNELPYGVSTKDILEDIEKISNPKVRDGKKTLTPDQANLKALILGALDLIRDESDKNSPVRIVIEPKSSRQNPQELMNFLLVNTRLESSISINMVMLGVDNKPKQKNIKDILNEWITFRLNTIVRRTQHRLNEVLRRIHILEGRELILLHIDEVIKVIRESEEPKIELIKHYSLSETQAEDILEIRLRQLAKLEYIKIEKELTELRSEKSNLSYLLDNEEARRELLIHEVNTDAELYGDKRRTLIEFVEEELIAPTVLDEAVTVTLSKNGWIKSRQGHALDASQFSYKSGDHAHCVIESRTIHSLILLDSKGRVYTIKVSDIPSGRGDGVPVSTLVDLQNGARVIGLMSALPDVRYLVSSSSGTGFMVKPLDLISRVKAGKAFMSIEENDYPLFPRLIDKDATHVASLSEKGRLLIFPMSELKELPKGKGIILMGLDHDEKLLSSIATNLSRLVILGTNRAGKEVQAQLSGAELKSYIHGRARKGSQIDYKMTVTGFA